MVELPGVIRPTLILNKDRVIRNIDRMAAKAQQNGVRFRPHFKTHQSAQVGEWFRSYGVDAITVSSVGMAAYFASHGWRDITIAFPVNLLQIQGINTVARKVSLNLLVESVETVLFLRKELEHKACVWLDIDTGHRRTGVWWNHTDVILQIAEEITASENLSFQGILTHAGHSYDARSESDIIGVHQDTVDKMNQVRADLSGKTHSPIEVSIGDTPCCSVVNNLGEIDEMRPGTFVFYDVRQRSIGSCTEEDIAIAVACPVVAKYEERNEIAIYGGAAHLSKDFIVGEHGRKVFGCVALFTREGWGHLLENCYVSHLSQEVGTVKASDELLGKIHVGDVLAILPVHSCLTVNLMREYRDLKGNITRCATI